MKRLTLFAWLILAAFAWAVDPPQLPDEVRGNPGEFIQVPATAEGPVQWYSPDAGLNVFPVHLLKDSKTAVVTATKSGRFRLVAWSAKGDEPSPPGLCVVVVGNAPDPDPGPGPEPEPEPEPQSPFTRELQKAYDAERDTDKADQFEQLTELYHQGAALAKDQRITTYGQLFTVMGDAARTLGVAGKLKGVQTVVQKHLQAQLSTRASEPIDRTKTETVFRGVAEAMGEVRP